MATQTSTPPTTQSTPTPFEIGQTYKLYDYHGVQHVGNLVLTKIEDTDWTGKVEWLCVGGHGLGFNTEYIGTMFYTTAGHAIFVEEFVAYADHNPKRDGTPTLVHRVLQTKHFTSLREGMAGMKFM